jgi:hypothetical protein
MRSFAEYTGRAMYRLNSSEKSAKVSACRLLKKPAVIDAIQKAIEKGYDESIASREYLIKEAHEIGKDAFRKDKHGIGHVQCIVTIYQYQYPGFIKNYRCYS